MRITYLYYFDSEELALFESKRLDLSSSASLSDVYKWSAYLKGEGAFVPLKFRNMTKTDTENFRSFSEGELRFNQTEAEFSFNNRIYKLRSRDPEQLATEFKDQAEKYLLSIPQHH